MKNKKIVILLLLTFFNVSVFATTEADVFEKIGVHIENMTKSLPGKITYDVKKIDLSKFKFDKCQKLEVYSPSGAKLVGQITIGVKCLDQFAEKPSNVIIQAEVAQEYTYVVATTKLSKDEELTKDNIREETGNIAIFYFPVYNKIDSLLGKKTKTVILEGQAIRDSYLALPVVIEYNKDITVISKVGAASVTAVGKAMNLAYEGQKVRVKMPNGKIVNATANFDGTATLLLEKK